MRLAELEPQFLRIVDDRTMGHVDELDQAQGIMFLCPKCFAENHGPIGTHSVICWFTDRGVPDEYKPGPGRWGPLGTGYGDLTLKAGSSSILLTSGCRAHFFITNGEIT